jgi:hypothetical protein
MVVIHNRECLVLADQRRLVIGRIRPRAPSELLHAGQSGFNLALVKELISIHSGRIFTYASGSTNLDLMSRSMLSLLVCDANAASGEPRRSTVFLSTARSKEAAYAAPEDGLPLRRG